MSPALDGICSFEFRAAVFRRHGLFDCEQILVSLDEGGSESHLSNGAKISAAGDLGQLIEVDRLHWAKTVMTPAAGAGP
jgi:hypothetical protein